MGRKIIIGGLPQHGKTTVASIIATRFGVTYGNTSDTIYETVATVQGVTVDELYKMDKEKLRPKLIEAGDHLCSVGGPAYLALQQLQKHDVVCGIRKPQELALIRASYPDCLFLWVIRPGYLHIKDSTQLSHKDADVVIVNSGSMADLEANITQGMVNNSLGLSHPGNSLWNLLHWFAFQQNWTDMDRSNFMQAFDTMLFITGRTCPCAVEFQAIKRVLPPPSGRDEFWNWTLIVHDWVNYKRGVPLYWEWTSGHPGFKALQEAFTTRTAEGILAGTAEPFTPTTNITYCKPCNQ